MIKISKPLLFAFKPRGSVYSAQNGATGKIIGLSHSDSHFYAQVVWDKKDLRVGGQKDGGYNLQDLEPRTHATHK